MQNSGAANPSANDGELTVLLRAYASGDQKSLQALIDRVYVELRAIAAGRLRNESCNPLMGPTALVNEAYLRLFGNEFPAQFANRRHFFAAASETMRRILVDQARERLTHKRGGAATRKGLDEMSISVDVPDEELVDIDRALREFARFEPEKSELVKLRFFVGMSEAEAAETLGISRATASRYWTYAKAWLFDWLKRFEGDAERLNEGNRLF